jgi:hypothetical protein
MARAARPEFAAIRLPCTERFTINITAEFRAMMTRQLAGIAQIGVCFPRTGVGALTRPFDLQRDDAAAQGKQE